MSTATTTARKPRTVKPPHAEKDWPARVYVFVADTRGGGHRWTLPEAAVEQLRLAHRLRNRLVELADGHDDAMRAVWSAVPAVADAEAKVDAAVIAWESAAAAVKAQRVRQRTRTPDCPDLDAAVAEASAALRGARAGRKAAQDATRKDPAAWARVKAALDDARTAHRASVRALYGEFSQGHGLYHATHNAIVADADAAEQRIIQARMRGVPARRRFARWDGTGRLAVVLLRQSGDPRRDPADLVPDGKWRNVLTVPQAPGRADERTIRFGMGRDLPVVEVPVDAHRVLPEGCDVTGAELVVKRTGPTTRVEVHVTARVPPPVPVTDGPTVVVHPGWRRAACGGVKVCTWRASRPVAVPAHAAAVGVVQDTPTSGRLVLPAAVPAKAAMADEVQSGRDVAVGEVRARLVEWLRAHPLAGEGDPTAAEVARWEAPARFAALALRWRDDPRESLDALSEWLEEWRRADKRSWVQVEGMRRRVVARRRDAYQVFAAWVASSAGRVVVDDTDYHEVKTKAGRAQPGVPGAVADRAARIAHLAAPGELRDAVRKAATRDGVPVAAVSHAGVSTVHVGCGHQNVMDESWLSETVTCQGCGRGFDQDANAVAVLLAREVG